MFWSNREGQTTFTVTRLCIVYVSEIVLVDAFDLLIPTTFFTVGVVCEKGPAVVAPVIPCAFTPFYTTFCKSVGTFRFTIPVITTTIGVIPKFHATCIHKGEKCGEKCQDLKFHFYSSNND